MTLAAKRMGTTRLDVFSVGGAMTLAAKRMGTTPGEDPICDGGAMTLAAKRMGTFSLRPEQLKGVGRNDARCEADGNKLPVGDKGRLIGAMTLAAKRMGTCKIGENDLNGAMTLAAKRMGTVKLDDQKLLARRNDARCEADGNWWVVAPAIALGAMTLAAKRMGPSTPSWGWLPAAQ